MKKQLLFLCSAALAVCFISSCTKDDNGDDAGGPDTSQNWWYRSNLGPKGVKSISSYGTLIEYDRNGRMTRESYQNGNDYSDETSYEYNSNNLVTKQTHTYKDWQGETITTVTAYEYGNKGKFCPPEGMPFHLYSMGLVPELSKITMTTDGKVTGVINYIFGTDGNLIIENTYNYEDESGQEIESCDSIFMNYKGSYPDSFEAEWDFIGPITYQENGMFDVYTEGFKNDAGEKRTIRHYHFKKNSPDAMLLEKYESIESYGSQTVETYEYDDKGNVVRMVEVNTESTGEVYTYVSTNEYEYDSHGNWIKETSKYGWNVDDPYVTERTIEYY